LHEVTTGALREEVVETRDVSNVFSSEDSVGALGAVVAEGDAKDVGGEILESRATIADGLAVNDPVPRVDKVRNSGEPCSRSIGLTEGVG
jgi:hypothetical protein